MAINPVSAKFWPHFEKQNGCHSQLFENHKVVLNLKIFQLASSNLHKKYMPRKASLIVIVSPDKSRGYLGFSTVTPPPQRFPFRHDNLKNILVRPFKFGMWVYMGNARNDIVL